MADKTPWKGGRLGAFHLGRRYKDVGAEVGRLYEAHNVHTGARALVLIPGARAEWEPAEAWRIRVSSQVEPPHIALEVEQAPGTGKLPEVSAMLDLATSAVERVEKKDEVRAHLTHEPIGLLRRWTGRSRRLLRSRWTLAAAGLATVALGVALWRYLQASGSQERAASAPGAEEVFLAHAPSNNGDAGLALIAYPLPAKPVQNQAKAPCKGRKLAVEINGGCWVALEQRPPCEDSAEYQGKCYLPVAESSPRLPQSVQQ